MAAIFFIVVQIDVGIKRLQVSFDVHILYVKKQVLAIEFASHKHSAGFLRTVQVMSIIYLWSVSIFLSASASD